MPEGRFASIAGIAGLPGFCVALSLSASGCQHFDRARECRAVSRLVNPVLRTIDAERHASPDKAETYRTIATQYDSLAGALIGLRPSDRRVQDAVGDYQKLTKEASRDARLFADALARKDMNEIGAARASATRTLKHETGALSHLDSVCRVSR